MVRDDNGDRARADASLAARARSGDESAFAELWTRHARAGAAAAAQFSSIADADDLVSEAYVRILRAMQQGGGPREAFRPYLYTTIRNIALDWRTKLPAVSLEVSPELVDPDDPQAAAAERTVTVRAYRTLPARWQAVLWYLDVEGMAPAETSVLLGLSPNATSALAVRAREGLKRAWLQAHVNDRNVPTECRWTTERMGSYARGALTRNATARFELHLEDCARCTALVAEVRGLSGNLAALLIPATLGGAAGAGLLAEALKTPTSASATGRAPSAAARVALVAGVGMLAVVAIGTGTWAATTGWQPGTSQATAEDSDSDSTDPQGTSGPPAGGTTPVETATATPPPPEQPEDSAEPSRPLPVLPQPPAVPADTVAPLAPQPAAPADDLLTREPTPTFSGSGEPGALVSVRIVDPTTFTLTTVGSALVAADGSWSLVPSSPLPDGTHAVRISQRDAAGNESAPAERTLTVDTVALVPGVDPLPVGPQLFVPIASGTGEPDATVALRDDTGLALGTALVAADGTWAFPLADPQRAELAVAALQTDRAGNVSAWSVDSAPVVFDRPSIPSPAPGAPLASQAGSTVVQVEFAGHPGMRVQVFIDGTSTGNLHTLEVTPIVRVTPPLADGTHTVGVRYVDPATGRVGSTASVSFTIG